MDMILFGKVMAFNDVQLVNADTPMAVTPSGILIVSNPLQSENAAPAISVVPSFNVISVLDGIVPAYL